MIQCQGLLSDLKLGHYMKIPPRAMFIAQFWGTILGGVFNYVMMTLIINAHRDYLDGTEQDPYGLWTGNSPQIYWGSALIFGALGPKRMFAASGNYSFVFYGFLLGAIVPLIQWGLSKKFPNIGWYKFNISLVAGGMSAFPYGLNSGILVSLIVCVIFQYWVFNYHKNWWKKYVFILSAALDTGAAFTGLVVFLFLGGGISPKLNVQVPSWWANYHTPEGNNAPYLLFDRCGASGNWTGGTSL
jgi:OPT family oligopeptide transporter